FALALTAAFLWPLGNRKLLLELENKNINLNAMQRVLGMSLGSLPVLLVLGAYGFYTSGLPSNGQLFGSLTTALGSGIVGGVLFYKAFQMVKHNPVALAAVEATQVVSILFTLLGEMLFKGAHWPGFYGSIGLMIILLGLSCHFVVSIRHSRKLEKLVREQFSLSGSNELNQTTA
ncbi:MAG: multidrug resistance efflux transporter family protein, partial [Hymenobacteraceae bacterium]|nr:multidrug resistance efflux transporter family protein [Hymenobacteraceae bacterium]